MTHPESIHRMRDLFESWISTYVVWGYGEIRSPLIASGRPTSRAAQKARRHGWDPDTWDVVAPWAVEVETNEEAIDYHARTNSMTTGWAELTTGWFC